MEWRSMSLAEIIAAAEQLPLTERLLLLERLARSLRHDAASFAEQPAPAGRALAAPQPSEPPPGDEELQELIAETLFEDLG
jgi:hypothetical protein